MTARPSPASPTTAKPPFAYFGGKTRLAPTIAAHLPAHDHYIEPFAGSLAVLLTKAPARAETVNDLDHRLVTFWRVLRDHPAQLARACALTPHARADYDDTAAEEPAHNDVEQARRVWVALTQGRSGGLNRTGWRRFTTDRGPVLSMPAYLAAYRDRLPACAARLAHVSLECRPALDVLRDYGTNTGALLYLDPPYLATTRNATAYAHDMGTEDEHRALAAAAHRCRAAVVLSGYDSPLYRHLYDGWHRLTLTSTSHRGTGGNPSRTEVLWSNVPLHPHRSRPPRRSSTGNRRRGDQA
ncbi:DNA adenine methylase [Streptomyces phytophilus]|uniref:DNA adenine methylase n=1 Tax=Streptomyces phytophilus TaxID=722715 RepID=UPI0015F0F4A1|nr:DNA adenine methylase [Streptomyces phytophilus]